MNQGVEAPADFQDDTLFTTTTTTTTRRTPLCSAAGKGSTGAGRLARPCLSRRRWRRPVAAPNGVCRSCPFQVAALLSAIRLPWWSPASVPCSGFCSAHQLEPLRRCWIDHPYGEEEITRLEDELLPAMESFLARIVDAVFRVGEAFSKRSGCNRSAAQGGPRGAGGPGRVGAGGHVG
jgi:hypothetical protein